MTKQDFMTLLLDLGFIGVPLALAMLVSRCQRTADANRDPARRDTDSRDPSRRGPGNAAWDPFIRELIPDLHLNGVVIVDRLSFNPDRQWALEDFRDNLSLLKILVYQNSDGHVLGYLAYFAVPNRRLEVIRFAVQPSARKCGIGSALLRRAVIEAVATAAQCVICDVSEELATAQLVLKKSGFLFDRKLDDLCRDVPDRDVYRFRMSVDTWCGE